MKCSPWSAVWSRMPSGLAVCVFLITITVGPASSWRTLAGETDSAAAPNVVLILSDDQAWTDYGFMGHPVIETPHLDRLASQSAVYRRGYVPTALCRPSLATIVTGLYAHQHKISGNDPTPARDPELRRRLIDHLDRTTTLPEYLAEAGYVSFQSGKWWEGAPQDAGFTDGMTRGFPKPGGRHGDEGLKIGREGLDPVFSFIEEATSDEKPFFVWYAPFLPHTPHNPPEAILAKYRAPGRHEATAKYFAMCEWFDLTCGQLLDFLDRNELAENTLVVYVCDNGWISRTPETPLPHDQWRWGFAPRSKQSPYEAGIRTPIMLRWPGHIEPKMDARRLASSIDLVPTILDACNITPRAPQLPGVSLLDDATGKRPIDRDTLFGESFAHDIADIDHPVKSLQYRWCIDGHWKLIVPYDGQLGRYAPVHNWDRGIKLFDLERDPHEEHNVAADHPEKVAQLRKKLETWWPLPDDAPAPILD